MSAPRFVPGNGEHYRWSAAGEEVANETIDALVNLDRRRTGGQGEVEAVHQVRVVHAGEPPERGLRLAGAGLRLDDDEAPVEGRLVRGILYRVGRAVYAEEFPKFGHVLEAVSLIGYVQPYRFDGFLGAFPGALDVVVRWAVAVFEYALV